MVELATGPLVLVADDDNNLRKILALFLRNAGYSVLEALNGREALELVKRKRPQAVLLDIMMPLLDGFTVCKLIKDDPETKHTAVLICTARNRKEDLIAAIKAGAEDYIIKPFTKETVLAKVEKALASGAKSASSSSKLMSPLERRDSRRKVAGWSLSWEGQSQGGIAPVYKTKVYDISLKGLSFEFIRCDICTGYEQGTVHPLCLFAKHAKRFQESHTLDFVLSIKKDIVIEVQGRIAHIYQWPDIPSTEKVGVMLTKISPEAHKVIEQYLEGKLALV
ncbi:MAG TPA: response regulator [Planctomycetota bacterium]|nr:response regulator [Planctomycetota bacterium]